MTDNLKNVIRNYKNTKNTAEGKKLKDEFLGVIMNYSKNLPNWGSLKVSVL